MPAEESRYRLHWWFPVAFAAVGVAAAVVTIAVIDVPQTGMRWVWLVSPVFITGINWLASPALRLDADGVRLGYRSASWDSIALVRRPFGYSLHGTSSRWWRFRVFLPLYSRHWQTGRLGDDLRRWAPALLETVS